MPRPIPGCRATDDDDDDDDEMGAAGDHDKLSLTLLDPYGTSFIKLVWRRNIIM